jgi:hypothetical protein
MIATAIESVKSALIVRLSATAGVRLSSALPSAIAATVLITLVDSTYYGFGTPHKMTIRERMGNSQPFLSTALARISAIIPLTSRSSETRLFAEPFLLNPHVVA